MDAKIYNKLPSNVTKSNLESKIFFLNCDDLKTVSYKQVKQLNLNFKTKKIVINSSKHQIIPSNNFKSD